MKIFQGNVEEIKVSFSVFVFCFCFVFCVFFFLRRPKEERQKDGGESKIREKRGEDRVLVLPLTNSVVRRRLTVKTRFGSPT